MLLFAVSLVRKLPVGMPFPGEKISSYSSGCLKEIPESVAACCVIVLW